MSQTTQIELDVELVCAELRAAIDRIQRLDSTQATILISCALLRIVEHRDGRRRKVGDALEFVGSHVRQRVVDHETAKDTGRENWAAVVKGVVGGTVNIVGPSPCEEPCAQVGQEGYGILALAECKAYIKQLRRHFGSEPEGAELFIKGNAHDFGTYYEVAVRFDEKNRAAAEWADEVAEFQPSHWDEEAKSELSGVIR